MKVNIRFLRQGLIKADAPEGFEKMSDKEKLDWASDFLSKLSDQELINAMSDFEEAVINSKGLGFFDEAPYASAIEEGEGDNIGVIVVRTKEWKIFSSIEGQDIAKDN